MYAEVAWVLVSFGAQVQPQIIMDPDYLPHYLSVSYDYNVNMQSYNNSWKRMLINTLGLLTEISYWIETRNNRAWNGCNSKFLSFWIWKVRKWQHYLIKTKISSGIITGKVQLWYILVFLTHSNPEQPGTTLWKEKIL